MRVTIIATSLNEGSKSQALALRFKHIVIADGVEVELIDLRELSLPLAGGSQSWSSQDAQVISKAVKASSHIVFAVPIYCYDVNAAAKNVIELVGADFSKKVVSFICAAGGAMSYMSVMGFANHLMLDYRSVIVPRFVYVAPDDWDGEALKQDSAQRLVLLLSDMQEIQVT